VNLRLKNKLYFIAKSYDCKVRFYSEPKEGVTGCYDPATKSIWINTWYGTTDSISTFFHELGHHYCTTNQIYKQYHAEDCNPQTMLRFCWRAESYVDKWAEKLFYNYFPNGYRGPYLKAYPNKQVTREWFRSYLDL
jgi:hypothetical protein